MIGKRWISLTLLSVIVPVGLLVSFRLTGVFSGGPEMETFTVDPVFWNTSRPADVIDVLEDVENYFNDPIASIVTKVRIVSYYENDIDYPAWGNDYIQLAISANTSLKEGFVYSVTVRFSEIDAKAVIDVVTHPEAINLHNLEVKKVVDKSTTKREALFENIGLAQPKDCSAKIVSYWVFNDKNVLDHRMKVTLETLYFNGTAYQKAILPINLKILTS